MWASWRPTNERLPDHQSCVSRSCELYCDRYSRVLRLRACARGGVPINSPAEAPLSKVHLGRQLSETSTYLHHLCLALLPASHHPAPRCRMRLHLCFLTTFASVCTTCLPGAFSSKEKWCFYFCFHPPFLQKHQLRGIHIIFFFLSTNLQKLSRPPPPPTTTTIQSIRQQASLTDSCLISHKLVLPLTHFLFCFLLLLIPFSTCPLPPSTSPWSSHFIFLPTNATQQSLKKCHFCLLLLFCNFFVSLLFSGEFIYRCLFFCPQLSDLSVSVSLLMSVSLSLSLTLCWSLSFLLLISFSSVYMFKWEIHQHGW